MSTPICNYEALKSAMEPASRTDNVELWMRIVGMVKRSVYKDLALKIEDVIYGPDFATPKQKHAEILRVGKAFYGGYSKQEEGFERCLIPPIADYRIYTFGSKAP